LAKLTNNRFELFNLTVVKCLNLLGLGEWYVSVGKKKLKDADAEMSHDTGSRRAFILINDIDSHVNDFDVENSACHEVSELLLAEFDDIIDKNVPKAQYDKIRHAVIQRLSRLLQYTISLEKEKKVCKNKKR